MNGSNGGYAPNGDDLNQEQIDTSYLQQRQRQQGSAAAPAIGGSRSAGNISYSREDETLRLLQQLAAEQSALLEQLHAVDQSVVQANTAVMRPTEQYLTIAANGA
jgi:hypothetical protein